MHKSQIELRYVVIQNKSKALHTHNMLLEETL